MGASPSSPTKPEPCTRRIREELHQLWVNPPASCRPGSSPVTDILHWEVVIDGPDGTPYAGGTFPVDVQFTNDHPMKPPKMTFKTKVYHPNINSEGQVVLDIFHDNWSPALTIEKLLLSIVSVLHDPMLDRPVNAHIARLYKTDIKLYEKKARAWTRRYASTPASLPTTRRRGTTTGRSTATPSLLAKQSWRRKRNAGRERGSGLRRRVAT
ncbi:unnamed protein product [Urochloa humidicola]